MEVNSSSQETRRDHVAIEIRPEEDLLSSIKAKMDCISLSHCVCRISQEFFKGNEDKYFPSTVSIGPFHHGKSNLKAMEDKKWSYFNTLLGRKPNTEPTLENCIMGLKNEEKRARKFYGETTDISSDGFVEMMLVDGCFIIELFLEFSIKSLRRRDDPCFSTGDKVSLLRRDLILFENQLPFFILQLLFQLVPIPKQCDFSLVELALLFFQKLIPVDNFQLPPDNFVPETHHLLDLIRQYVIPTPPHQIQSSIGGGQKLISPPATQLRLRGIQLERASSKSPLNIKFFEIGELAIPPLKIDDYTEILFRNLIAMELCHPGCPKYVTSYAVLMDRLILSKRDVGLLYDKRILVDEEEKDRKVLFLFKKLHENVDIKVKVGEFYYGGLCERINSHQEKKRQVFVWQKVRHIYDRTHMGIAGLSLAILMLVFLFTGLFFTALSFLLHHFQ